MKCITTEELGCMEVINLCDGSKLGYPSSFEIDVSCGSVTAIIIGGDGGVLGFGKCKEFRIPWCNIECFGEDAILVKLTGQELSGCECACNNRRKRGFFR